MPTSRGHAAEASLAMPFRGHAGFAGVAVSFCRRCRLNPAAAGFLVSTGLGDAPGVAGVEELVELAFAQFAPARLDLLRHQRVVDRPFDVAKNTERGRAVRRVSEPREGECERRVCVVLVVEEQRT